MACPGCGHRIDRHVSPEHPDAVPRKGDIAICYECGMVNVFVSAGHESQLAPIKQAEFDRLDGASRDSLMRAISVIGRRRRTGGFQS